MDTKKALVILSGGQDSTTCLFWAKERYEELHAITFDYGQTHQLEIVAAEKVGKMAGVATHEFIGCRNLLSSVSPLMIGSEQPLEKYESHEQMEQIIADRREKTFVPMRNALFLTVAANRAEAIGAKTIVIGVCQMDNANYDDCRAEFIQNAQIYISYSLGYDHRKDIGEPIRIAAPLLYRTKADSIDMAMKLPGCMEALAYTHTSYDGQYPPTDMNHANVLRAEGFRIAKVPDPLVVRAWREGLMQLPETENYDSLRG